MAILYYVLYDILRIVCVYVLWMLYDLHQYDMLLSTLHQLGCSDIRSYYWPKKLSLHIAIVSMWHILGDEVYVI